ncbi:MAG: TIGR03936 family radical SAM-associated protein [Eubacteriales bacterium]
MLPVRVFFKKLGYGVYFSHLDLQRAVFRAINRSCLDAVYTSGFNPHIKASFAAPLSLYQKSLYEVFDFYLVEDRNYDEIAETLKSSFPPGLEVFKAAPPKHPFSSLYAADYEMTFKLVSMLEDLEKSLSGSMIIEKKTKKGGSEVDISRLIYSKSLSLSPSGAKLEMRCACGGNLHLNARHVEEFLKDKITGCEITRLSLLTRNGLLFE